jgi:hypothetical protein
MATLITIEHFDELNTVFCPYDFKKKLKVFVHISELIKRTFSNLTNQYMARDYNLFTALRSTASYTQH